MNWFLINTPRPEARVRLVCLPWAGAGAAAYRDWSRNLPAQIEVCALQLPGRGWRVRETPKTDLSQLADDVTDAIRQLDSRPTILFGHSFGAWLGLLVARRLEAFGQGPVALFASGRRSPSHPRRDTPMRHLDDPGFVSEIQRRYGAIHPEIAADKDLLELLLPALRADVAALEAYDHPADPRVECPVIALGGADDPIVPPDELSSWRGETTGDFDLRTFPGGHFFLQDDPSGLLRWISEEVEARWMARVGTG